MRGKKPFEIRIIAGDWRSRRLPVADRPDLRPTTDRIRETVFNWLSPYIVGARCLDLFAGTGALGFEALSRGAKEAVMIELDKRVVKNLKKSADLLNTDRAKILNRDTLTWLQTKDIQAFDIVFLDPPFQKNLHGDCLEKLLLGKFLHRNALIYLEHPVNEVIKLSESLRIHREGRAGGVSFSLLALE